MELERKKETDKSERLKEKEAENQEYERKVYGMRERENEKMSSTKARLVLLCYELLFVHS